MFPLLQSIDRWYCVDDDDDDDDNDNDVIINVFSVICALSFKNFLKWIWMISYSFVASRIARCNAI